MSWMENFTQATIIMILGMGLVFLFVASLVVLIQISARILGKASLAETLAVPTPALAPALAAPLPAPVAAAPAPSAPPAADNRGALVAAIAIALKLHSEGK